MLRRADWHGGAKFATGVAGTSYRVTTDRRVYVLTGTTAPADPPVLVLPFTGEQEGTDLSKVLKVDPGFSVTVVCPGAGTTRIEVHDRAGTVVATVDGGDAARIVCTEATDYYGTWGVLPRTML